MKLWEILIPLTETPSADDTMVHYIPMSKHSGFEEQVLKPSKIKYYMQNFAPAFNMLFLPDVCPLRVEGADSEIRDLVSKIKAYYGVNIYYVSIGNLYTSFHM